MFSDMRSSPRAGVRRAYDTSPIGRVGSPHRLRGHETLARASLRLWPGQILARLVLSTLLLIFLLGGLLGLELGVKDGEYDPDETHGPDPGRQADPQEPIEGVRVGLADHEGGRDGDVEDRQFGTALGHPDGLVPVGLPRGHRHGPYDAEGAQGVEKSQGREHTATELRKSCQIGPGASRAQLDHLLDPSGPPPPPPPKTPKELRPPGPRHKRALHNA